MKLLSVDEEQLITIDNYSMDNRTAKALSNFFSIFSDQTRLKIISLLSLFPMCVGDLSKLLKINQTTISHQLKILKFEGIVDSDKVGKVVTYKVVDQYVNEVLESGVDRNNQSFVS